MDLQPLPCHSEREEMGDLNAKTGTQTKETHFKSMGAFGKREKNERGGCLIEFAEEHKLIITNTPLQKPQNRE